MGRSFVETFEKLLENRFYSLVFCVGTTLLLVAYVIVGSNAAEPARFRENPFVQIDESEQSLALDAWSLDAVNRAFVRIARMADVLDARPTRLQLAITAAEANTPLAIEYRVLRLWMDEKTGFVPSALVEVETEARARAILALVFPQFEKSKRNSDIEFRDSLREAIRSKSSQSNELAYEESWSNHIASIKDACRAQKHEARGWADLCRQVLRENPTWASQPTPIGLVPWLTTQILASVRDRGAGVTIARVRELFHGVGGEEKWSQDPTDWGAPIHAIVSRVAPERLSFVSEKPRAITLTTCEVPTLADVGRLQVQRVKWVDGCGNRFVVMGVDEIKLAIKKGWVDSRWTAVQLVEHLRESRSEIGGQDRAVKTSIAPQIVPQSRKEVAEGIEIFGAPVSVVREARI